MRSPLTLLLLTGLARSFSLAQSTPRSAPLLPDPVSESPVHRFAADQLIPAFAVELAYNKTTVLVFPSAIRAVDLGSRDILADKVPEVENVLRLKSNRVGFNETNLSVLTTDGRLYSFVANYTETPAALAILIKPPVDAIAAPFEFASTHPMGSDRIQFKGQDLDQRSLRERFDQLLYQRVRAIRVTRRPGMRASLTGVYVEGDLLVVRLRMENRSDLPLTLRPLRVSLVDARGRWHQSTQQELDQAILQVHPQSEQQLTSHSAMETVYALRSPLPTTRQRLRLRMEEASGGRSLDFLLTQRQILRAQPLSPDKRGTANVDRTAIGLRKTKLHRAD